MNHTKILIKILLLVQCFLFFCTCDKEIVTTEQHRLSLVDFVMFPFNEEFADKTDLEKYVLKKFGKPDNVVKGGMFGEHREERKLIVDRIELEYKNRYQFRIYRGVNKRLEIFARIFMLDFVDLKYGINKETTIKDIKKLFGQPEYFTDVDNSYIANYSCDNSPYYGRLRITFGDGKLNSMTITINVSEYEL